MQLQSQLLVLAIDYHAMFKALTDRVPPFKQDAEKQIAWAKEYLKKNDRIIWFLRWVRLDMIKDAEFYGRHREPSSVEKAIPPGTLEKELKALSAKAGRPYSVDDVPNVVQLKQSLQHFMSIEDRDMQSRQFGYEPPVQLLNELSALEDAYKEKAQADERMLEPQTGDKAFIKFGNGWAWWALSRGYCSEEAKAMGHCGNQGQVTGDQIISLREPRKKNGKTYWEPHLTFIFDKSSGLIGESKGRGNDKPAARYHPYIISLLKDKRIKGMKGGGYLPSHNFSMNDLPEEERAKLEAEKPALMTLKRYLKKNKYYVPAIQRGREALDFKTHKPDKFILKKTVQLLGLTEQYNAPRQGFIVHEWKDLPAFVDERGDDAAKWIMDVDQGNETLDIYETGMSKSDVRDLIDDLPKNVVQNIGLTLEYEYPEELQDFIEVQGEDGDTFTWEPDQVGDVKDFLGFLEDDQSIETEVSDNLQRAYLAGNESGAQGEMHKALISAVAEATDSNERITIAHEGDGWWDGKIFAVLKLVDAVLAAAECEEGEEGCATDEYENSFTMELVNDIEVKVGEHKDFNGFDNVVAIESMSENYSESPKHMKKPVKGQEELFPEALESGPPFAAPEPEEDEEALNAEMARPYAKP